jgi:hypothetical protein
MPIKNENLARVGSAIQMGAMIAQMIDTNTTGADDKIGKIAQQIGAGCVKAAAGNLSSGADLLDAAGDSLKEFAAEMRSGV